MDASLSPLLLDDDARTQLRPAFDHALGIHRAELWEDGSLRAVHGTEERFATAAALTDTVDAFLCAHGVRPLSEIERFELHGGLLRAKGSTGYRTLIRQLARRS